MAPGIAEVLRLNEETHKFPGLLGAAISGAGSTMIAFVTENGDAIGAEMVRRIESKGATAHALQLSVDNVGRRMSRVRAIGQLKGTQNTRHKRKRPLWFPSVRLFASAS